MALQGTFSDAGRPSRRAARVRAVIDDRARAFAKARRHTLVVRVLRLALPGTALLALASYGLGVGLSLRTPLGKIETSGITATLQNLTMSNPRYEGFNKDGSHFAVAAKTAVQDIKQQGPIELNVIDGKLVQPNSNEIVLTAPRGTFDPKVNRLELFDDIKIRGSDGMRADLKQATVLTKENKITSNRDVAIDMAAGQVRANEMAIDQATKTIDFGNGVVTRLKPPKPSGQQAAQPQQLAGQQRMLGGSDAPVDITSRTLHIDDLKKIAIFTGDVVAKQGEASLSGPELHAFYESGPAQPGAPQAPAALGQPGSGKLKRLFVPSNVVMTRGADRVTSDQAEFDALQQTAALVGHVVMNSGPDRHATADRADLDSQADTALLTGSVIVTQERNQLKGERLYLDRRGGVAKLSTPAAAGKPAPGRISARFYQAATAGKPVPKKEQAKSEASGFVFRTDPNAPIDIDAETLDVLDRNKTATFKGAVRAVQGEFVMVTPELVATYSGEAGLAMAGQPQGAAKQPQAQLTKVRANQHVEVTGNGQSVIGDWADFDVKQNKVTVGVNTPGGHATLKKGNSISYAPKVIIDLTSGEVFMEQDSRKGPSVSASPTEQRAPYALPDLPAKKLPVAAPVAPTFDTDPTKCTRAVCIKIDPKDSGTALGKGSPSAADKSKSLPWQTQTAPPAAAPAPKPKAAPETSGWTSP